MNLHSRRERRAARVDPSRQMSAAEDVIGAWLGANHGLTRPDLLRALPVLDEARIWRPG